MDGHLRQPTPVPRRLRRLGLAQALGRTVPVADRPLARLLGLAGLAPGRAGPGLLLRRCRSIHSFGMRFELDIFFLDGDDRPLRRIPRLAPGRIAICRRAVSVLELPAAPRPAAARGANPGRSGG